MKWEPVDIIVLILVIVTGILLILPEIHIMFGSGSGGTLTPDSVKLIGHAIGAMIAIVSLYVGNRLGKRSNKNKKEDEG